MCVVVVMGWGMDNTSVKIFRILEFVYLTDICACAHTHTLTCTEEGRKEGRKKERKEGKREILLLGYSPDAHSRTSN